MKQRETEHKFIIPISAAILKHSTKYDEVLESISKPLMSMVDYEFSNSSEIVVNNDIDYMYRYPDFTEHVKFTYEMMDSAVSSELMEEICLLIAFENIKKYINTYSDIPNKSLDTLISIMLSNGGRVSNSKQDFANKLLDEERLKLAEDMTIELIKKIKADFSIDIQEVMNHPK